MSTALRYNESWSTADDDCSLTTRDLHQQPCIVGTTTINLTTLPHRREYEQVFSSSFHCRYYSAPGGRYCDERVLFGVTRNCEFALNTWTSEIK